ncbi:MAG: Rrf2 family transcriptional regulator [Bacteroidales bacterium]|nr:Rrf2 family transcriptional regulator [Bacteroidales bacterium]
MALAVLAKEYGKEPVPMSLIAEKENIPLRFIEGILLTLKNRGILNSTRGKSGGYYLMKKPEDVSLLEIVQYFEGSVSMLPCACDKFNKWCKLVVCSTYI